MNASFSDENQDAQSSAVVIWNPSAGTTETASDLREAIEKSPQTVLQETGSPDEAVQAVKDAAEQGVRRIIAAGGDGTVHTVVAALYELREKQERMPELAVLPLGTGNDLARSLGMPLDPVASLDICLTGTAKPLDLFVLETEGERHVAANMVTAGNTGKYTSVLTDEMKRRWGPLCYLRGGVDVLQELDVYEVKLAFDDEPDVTYSALNLFFANGRTSGGGLVVSQDAELDDGLMDVLILKEGTPMNLATLTVDYLLSDIRNNDMIEFRRCRAIHVHSSPALPFSADGDAVDATSGILKVIPAALQVVRSG